MSKSFSRLLLQTNNAGMKFQQLKKKFDRAVEEKYGFHYSDYDLDWIIDAIDYGLKEISFKEFDAIMKAKDDDLMLGAKK